MTKIVHTNVLLEQRGQPIVLVPRRRRLSTIVKQHAPAMRRAIPLVFRAGEDPWHVATKPALDRASRLRAQYKTTLVGPRDTVVFMTLPLGSGGGSTSGIGKAAQIGSALAAIAMIALAGPFGVPAALGLEGATLFAVQAGLVVGGVALSYAAQKAAAAKKKQSSDFTSISGGGNVPKPGDRKPLIYGKCWSAPPLSQSDYFQYNALITTLFKRMTLGLGKFQVHQVRVGDSLIWDEESGIQAPFNGAALPGLETAVEILYGTASTIIPGDVATSTEVSGQELPRPGGNPEWTPWFRLAPPGGATSQVLISHQYTSLTGQSNSGKPLPSAGGANFQGQRLDPITGDPTGPIYDIFSHRLTATSTTAVHYSGLINLPEFGEWRIRGQNAYPDFSPNYQNSVTWDEMSAFLPTERVREKTTEIVLRVSSIKGLNITSFSDVQVLATRIVPVWTGSAWVEQPTRKALWAYADLIRSEYGLNDPDGLDLAKVYEYANRSDLAGFDTYDGVLPSVSSIWEASGEVLHTLRADPVRIGAVHSFVRDESAAEAGGRRVITRRQTVLDSASADYELATEDDSAGDVIVEFFRNGDPKRPEEVRQDKFPSTRTPKRYKIAGISSGEHALRHANWLAAISRYRSSSHKITTEWDGRLIYPGTHILSDIWYLSAKVVAGVVAIAGLTLTLDIDLPTDLPTNPYASIRSRTGREWGLVQATVAGPRSLLLNAQDVAAQPTPLADALANDTQDPTTITIGELPDLQETYIARAAVPTDPDHVEIDMVFDDPRVWQILGETVVYPQPPSSAGPSVITEPVIPTVHARCVTVETGIELVWGVGAAKGAVSYTAQLSYDAGTTYETLQDQQAILTGRKTIRQSDDPLTFRARAIGVTGLPGPWKEISFATIAPVVDGGLLAEGSTPLSALDQLVRDILSDDPSIPGSRGEATQATADAFARGDEAFESAGAAFEHATEAFARGDAAFSRGDAAFARGDAAFVRGDAAFARGDAAFARADAAFTRGDAGFARGDEAFSRADAAFARGDAGFTRANEAFERGDAAFGHADAVAGQLGLALSVDPIDRGRSGLAARALRDDIEALAATLADVQSRVYDAEGRFVEIGLEKGPEGVYRIAGEAALAGQISAVSITIDTLKAKFTLLAEASIDGDLDGLLDQIASVGAALDALKGSLDLYVRTVDFAPLTTTVQNLSVDFEAAQQAIALKASQAVVSDLQTAVSSALVQVTALGQIVASTSAATIAADTAMRDATIEAILARLHEIDGGLGQALANASQAMGSRIDDQGRALSEASKALVAVASRSAAQIDELTRTVASGDAASAEATRLLAAQLNQVDTGLPATLARLIAEETARATQDAAEATARSNLAAQVNAAGTGLSATLARLVTEETTRATADSALAGRTNALESSVNNASTGLPATLARLVTEETTRANADTGLSSRATALESSVNNATTGLSATLARLVTEENARVTADTAEANARIALASQLNNATTGLPATLARLVTEESARAAADAALATRATVLEVTVNDQNTGLVATRARLFTEESTRSSADSALAGRATALESTVNNTASGLSATLARLVTEETTRAAADTAEAVARTAISTQLNDATTGLPATRSRLITEEGTRSTADTALSTRSTALESAVNNTTTGLSATLARLINEETARSTADSAITSSISALSAQVNSTTTGLPYLTTRITNEETARAAADTAEATARSAISTQVNNATTGLPATLARLVAEEGTRSTADTALGNRTSALESSVNNTTTGLSATLARLVTEETTRAAADTAEANARIALAAQVNNATTGLPYTLARLVTEETTRANADTALSSRTAALEASVNNATTGLPATLARLVTEEGTRATADTAEANARLAVSAQINHATTGLPATLARLVTEETTRAAADTALAGRTTALEGTVNNATTGLSATLARLVTEETTRATADTAEANARIAVSAQINDAVTGLPATRARLITEEGARASADSAISGRTSALESSVNNGTTGLVATRARLITEESTRAAADAANVNATSTLSAQVNNDASGLPYTLARVVNEEIARAVANASFSTSLATLSAQVNNDASGLPYTLARVVNEEIARAVANNALTTRTTGLESTVNNATTGLEATRASFTAFQQAQATTNSAVSSELVTQLAKANGISAYIDSEVLARVAGDSSISALLNSVAVKSDYGSASGQIQLVAIGAPSGYSAAYRMQLVANGAAAGITVLALPNGTSRILLSASQLLIGDGNGGVQGFVYDAAAQRLTLPNLRVTKELIAAGALSGGGTVAVPANYYCGGGGNYPLTVIPDSAGYSRTFDTIGPATIDIITHLSFRVDADVNGGNGSIYVGVDGSYRLVQALSGSSTLYGTGLNVLRFRVAGAGTHKITLAWACSAAQQVPPPTLYLTAGGDYDYEVRFNGVF